MSLSRWLATLAALVTLGVAGFWFLQLEGRANEAIAAQQRALATHTTAADQLAVERGPNGLTLHLDRGGSPSALAGGWSSSEVGLGVWSDGHKAVLRLDGLPADHAVTATFTLEPFLAPTLPAQEVDARANGRLVGKWTLTQGGFQTQRLDLPPEAQSAPGVVNLELDLPNADSPLHRAPGNHDVRVLGINLKTVAVSN